MVSIPGRGGKGNLTNASAQLNALNKKVDQYTAMAVNKVKISYDEALNQLRRQNVDEATVKRVEQYVERVRKQAINDVKNFAQSLKSELQRQATVAASTAG